VRDLEWNIFGEFEQHGFASSVRQPDAELSQTFYATLI
jgi:hypothetical protein